jgi:hypothetical protein
MPNKTRNHVLTMSSAALALLAISIPATSESRHTLEVENGSGFNIYHLQMSSSNDHSWERDLLGSRILFDGNSFTVTGIVPGLYDIRVVDEDNDACVVNRVRVDEDMTWDLTPLGLVGCEFR